MADEVNWLVEIAFQAKAEQDWLLKSSVKSRTRPFRPTFELASCCVDPKSCGFEVPFSRHAFIYP